MVCNVMRVVCDRNGNCHPRNKGQKERYRELLVKAFTSQRGGGTNSAAVPHKSPFTPILWGTNFFSS